MNEVTHNDPLNRFAALARTLLSCVVPRRSAWHYASINMKILFSTIMIFLSAGCAGVGENSSENGPCSSGWYSQVEERVPTGDSQGHGPDLGSLEWRSVIEFKLGIRDSAEVPSLETEQWCRYIHELFIKPYESQGKSANR